MRFTQEQYDACMALLKAMGWSGEAAVILLLRANQIGATLASVNREPARAK